MKPSEKPMDRLDQFFKNKLDEHAIAPPENAWAKVEAELSKKNNAVVWRLAAAILITGALITIIYWSQRTTENDKPVFAQKKIEKTEPAPTNKDHSKTPDQKMESLTVLNKTAAAEKPSGKNVVQPKVISSEEIQRKETVAVNHVENAVEDNKIVVEEKIKAEATPKVTVASSQQKPIKLEFTLEDLTSVETVATPSEVKNSGLKKVLELAREMKEGEGPLSNLKEKKNELFARNFITGKERTQ